MEPVLVHEANFTGSADDVLLPPPSQVHHWIHLIFIQLTTRTVLQRENLVQIFQKVSCIKTNKVLSIYLLLLLATQFQEDIPPSTPRVILTSDNKRRSCGLFDAPSDPTPVNRNDFFDSFPDSISIGWNCFRIVPGLNTLISALIISTNNHKHYYCIMIAWICHPGGFKSEYWLLNQLLLDYDCLVLSPWWIEK